MTDNEVVNGLELCLAEKSTKQTCGKCPYHQFGKLCKVERSKDALDLINRLNAEIERLQKNEQIATAVIAESSAEIEKLKSDNDILSKNMHNLCKELDAEKLKNF